MLARKALFPIFLTLALLLVTAKISGADVSGTIGTRFTIAGTGFGSVKPKVYIEHEKKPGVVEQVYAKVEEWSDTSITCIWSKAMPAGTYTLWVNPNVANASPVAEGTFTIMLPHIDSITPQDYAPGATITIDGQFFTNKKPKVYLIDHTTQKKKTCNVLSSTMNPTTGASSLSFVAPKQGFDSYEIVLQTDVSKASAAEPRTDVLDKVEAEDIFLSNGRIYYSDHYTGEIRSVSVNGGDVTVHYADTQLNPQIVHASGKIFVLDYQDSFNSRASGGLLSMPENSEGLMRVRDLESNSLMWGYLWDLESDDTSIYWSDASKIFRTSAANPKSSADVLFEGDPKSILRFVADSGILFASESLTGNIYRIDPQKGEVTRLVTYLGSGATDRLSGGMPLMATGQYLYAIDNSGIIRINKVNGDHMLVAAPTYLMGDRICLDREAIYWWDTDGKVMELRRLDDQTDTPTTVTTIPFTWDLTKYYSDGANVYWFLHGHYNSQGHIQKVPVTGGAAQTISSFDETLGSVQTEATFVTGDETHLYWLGINNGVLKVSKNGGSPSVVSRQLAGGIRLASYGKYLFYGSSYEIDRIPKTGQVDLAVEWTPSSSDSKPSCLTADGNSLYWIDNDNSEFHVYSKNLSTGAVNMIGSFPGYALQIFPYKDVLFVSKKENGNGAITVIPKDGGTEEYLITKPITYYDSSVPAGIFAVNNILYFSFSGIYSLNFNTKKTPKLLSDQSSVDQLYVDSAYIYWTQTGGVYRMRLSGGKSQTFYTGMGISGIAGDFEHIYWGTYSNLLSRWK
jgi:hypothetical protein